MILNFFCLLISIIFFPPFYIRILRNKLRRDKDLKILVIENGKIGDLVCGTPVFREIKKNFPESFLIAGIREQSYGVVKNNPHIDKAIFLNSKKYQGLSGTIRLFRTLNKEKIVWSVNLSPYTLNTTLPFWLGAVKRITSVSRYTGRISRLAALFSNYRLEYKKRDFKLRHNLQLLKFLGIRNFSEKKEIFITDLERIKVKKFFRENNLNEKDFLIGIAATVGNKLREWDPLKFSQLADRLIEELRAKIIFVGAPFDENTINKVRSNMKNNAIVNLDLKIHELGAFFEKIKLFISAETGPLHIAHAVGTPLVNIVGPVDVKVQPPCDKKSEIVKKDIYCAPCCFLMPAAKHCKEGHLRCLKDIMVDDVFKAVIRLLKRLKIITIDD